MRSMTVALSIGDDTRDKVMIQPRIASPIGILDGDDIELEVTETGGIFTVPVKVTDSIKSDVLINDMYAVGMLNGDWYGNMKGCTVALQSGRNLFLPTQEMWAGMKMVQNKAVLFFHGVS